MLMNNFGDFHKIKLLFTALLQKPEHPRVRAWFYIKSEVKSITTGIHTKSKSLKLPLHLNMCNPFFQRLTNKWSTFRIKIAVTSSNGFQTMSKQRFVIYRRGA